MDFPSAWAKLRQDESGTVTAWLPLKDHSLDVAHVCTALMDGPVLRRRLARLAGLTDLDRNQRTRLSILGGIHDIGKTTRGFYNRWNPAARPQGGHVREALSLLYEGSHHPLMFEVYEALRLDVMTEWFIEGESTLIRYLHSVFCHHGTPVRPGPFQAELWKSQDDYDPLQAISDLLAVLWEAHPEVALKGGALPDTPAFLHAFMGLVTLADWIASDTRFFPLIPVEERRRASSPRTVADDVLSSIGIGRPCCALWVERSPKLPSFQEAFDLVPRPAQHTVAELPLPSGPSSLILEAETGSGKTEAALWWFFRLFEAGMVDGLYFALPTRSAARQIYGRISKTVERLMGSNAPPVVLAVPGYIEVDGVSGIPLPGFQVLWPDGERERLRFRGWAGEHPKRYFAGTIVAGTVDQALLSTLQVRHSHMRATALLRHLLVMDEIHASDSYMTRLTEELLNRQAASGGHSLLMSATLGSAARRRFLGTSLPALEEAESTPYPLLSIREGTSARLMPIGHHRRARRIEIQLRGHMEEPDVVAEKALEAARKGAKVAVLRNTVREAVAVQAALENSIASLGESRLLFTCEGVPAPHHGRFSRTDRLLLDKALEDRLKINDPVVVSATQTIEQSLDIDFDFLITDLCPMDVLLQRLGRLHRHDRQRPTGFERPLAVVLVPERDLASFLTQKGAPSGGPSGIGSVYEDLGILQATLHTLNLFRELRLPSDNRRIIERCLHPEILEEQAHFLGGKWPAHFEQIWGVRMSSRGLADLSIADWSLPLDDDRSFFAEHSGRHVMTRLGEQDRLCRFVHPLQGPFGRPCNLLTLSAHLARDAPDDAQPYDVVQEHRGFTFRFGGIGFVYDRWGLRRITEDSSSTD